MLETTLILNMDPHPIETFGRRLLRNKRSLILSAMTDLEKTIDKTDAICVL
jgi:hypothetical protein